MSLLASRPSAVWAALASCALISAVARGEAPTSQPDAVAPHWPQPAPPSAAAIADGEALIRGVFKEAFSSPATNPATQPADPAAQRQRDSAFASRFLYLGVMAENDAGERYALLTEARNKAAAAGNTELAMQAIGRLAQLFNPDPGQVRDSALSAIGTAAASAATPDEQEDNARAALLLVESALAVGDFDLLARATDVAGPVAGRAKNTLLSGLLDKQEGLSGTLAGLAAESDAAQAAARKLEKDPADRESNRTLGTYLCVNRDGWTAGLALLAKAAAGEPSDAPDAFLNVAKEDTADVARSANASARLAGKWWQAAQGLKGRPRFAALHRAAYWYLRALPWLTGGDLDKARPRIAEFHDSILQPGLLADLYDSEKFIRHARTRVDPMLDFNWDTVSPDPHLRQEYFSICWDGYLTAPRAGKYKLLAKSDDGVIVTLDGKRVIDHWQSGKGEFRATIDMTGKPQALTVLYFQVTGPAHFQLLWTAPSEKNEVLIPATSFSHEPALPWGPAAVAVGGRPPDASPCAASDGGTIWFAKFPDRLPWHVAQRHCECLGGHLAWARRSEDNDVLEKLADGATVWLGGTDEPIENRWEWTNGQRIDPDLFNWREGEPNGGVRQNFLSIGNGHGWDDANDPVPYMCQWDH